MEASKVNLGCSDSLLPGFLNVDICTPPNIGEQLFSRVDLRMDFPWGDSSIDYIRAFDIIEHLPDKIHTMNEIWRVLRPGGKVEIEVPTTDGPGAFQDPTHVSYWNRNSFFYYTHGDPHRERFGVAYGVKARFRVVREQLTNPGGVPKLWIMLEAVK